MEYTLQIEKKKSALKQKKRPRSNGNPENILFFLRVGGSGVLFGFWLFVLFCGVFFV